MIFRRSLLALLVCVVASCASGGGAKPIPGRAEKLVTGAEGKLRQGLTNAAGRRYKLALSLYQKLDDRKNAADIYNRLGRLFLIRGDFDSAQRYVLSAKLVAEKEGYKDVSLSVAVTEALLLTATGSPEKAKSVLEAAGVAADRNNQTKIENVLGRISMALGDYDAARARFESALAKARAEKNLSAESASVTNLGALFLKLNEPDKALEQFQKALEIDRSLESALSIGEALHHTGSAYELKNDLENSLYYYGLALKVNVQVDIPERAKADRKAIARVERLLEARTR
jgi:tetratricopeptide (TPR) repeat protein